MKKVVACILISILLSLASVGWVSAWPNQPPNKATISGPGLDGEVPITDPEALRVLQLGVLEDFEAGAIAEPKVGEEYRITRWFEGGQFNFGVLHYYPGAAGKPGYVLFQDGPDLKGDHTPYNEKWFQTTSAGEARLKMLLANLGVGSALQATDSFASESKDNAAKGSSPATSSPVANDAGLTVLLLTVGGLVVVMAVGAALARRPRS